MKQWILATVIAVTVLATVGSESPKPLKPPRHPPPRPPRPLIVPGYGIARVHLGIRPKLVRKLLGHPPAVRRLRQPAGGRSAGDLIAWTYPKPQLQVRFRKLFGRSTPARRVRGHLKRAQPGRRVLVVGSISTTSRRWHTRAGIGVGSTEQAVRHAYIDVTCENFVAGVRDCSLGGQRNGDHETDFFIKAGRVREVGVTFGYLGPY